MLARSPEPKTRALPGLDGPPMSSQEAIMLGGHPERGMGRREGSCVRSIFGGTTEIMKEIIGRGL